ncbi:MAG: RICIN domain-containing protein [Actinomycetota bacterium]|nr:RICIN domain-containing protein [Actinomycetota bacterium]
MTTLIVTLSLIAASLIPLTARVAEASSGPVNQTYQLINSSGKCLEAVGGRIIGDGIELTAADDGAYIQQWTCNRGVTQAFVLEPVAIAPLGQYFRLLNQNSGKCLDVEYASTADGAVVQQLTCTGADNQTFSRGAQPGGGYRLVAKHSGKCLDVGSGSTADGANVVQATCDSTRVSERFKMARSYSAGTGSIPTHSFKSFSVDDRAAIQVDLASGNLLFTDADLGGLERSWNSLSTDNSTELGYGWTFNLGRDIYLDADCANIGPRASMPQLLKFDFTRQPDGSYTAPTGMDLDLARISPAGTPCTAESWNVTSQFSPSTMSFGGPTGSRRYLTQMSDVNGNTVSVVYDEASGTVRTNSVVDSRGRSVTYLRAVDGAQVSGLQDWVGRTESYSYDAAGRMVQASDIGGAVTSYGYDANNLVTSITDPNGNVTSVEYDSFRRVSAITQGGLRWAFGYDLDASGVCSDSAITPPLTRTYVVPPDYHTATFCRDDEGRVRESRDGHNARVIYGYDVNSNPTQAGWLDSQAATAFDAQSRPTSSTDATGATSWLSYADPANPFAPTAQTNPQGNTYGFGYDSRGQTTQISDPAGSAQTYTYNADGTISSSTDQRGLITAYGYDSAQRLTTMDPPGGALGASTYTYDGLDRVETVTDGKGQQTGMSYDAMDRTARMTYADGSFVAYSYDGNGNMTSAQDPSGTTSYTYDALNRLTTETAPGAETITYGYDRDGMLTSYTDGGGTTQYEYGDGLKVRRVTDPSGAVTNYQTETAPNNPRSFHPDFPVVTAYPNGVTVTQTPDLAGRVASMSAQGPSGASLFNRAYSYQNPDTGAMTGLLQTETDYNANTSTRYVYDALDRLSQARTSVLSTGAPVSDFSYGYDAAGNRTSTTTNGSTVAETSNDANQLTAQGGTTFGYDPNGNLTSSSAGFTASYNAGNQTASMTGASGSTVSTSYTGVGQSRLAALGGQTITNSGLGITRVGGDRFTRGPDGRLVSMRTAEGETFYYLTDTRGTVIGMVGPGEVTSFDPCGPDTGGGVGGGVGGDPCVGTDPAALTTFAYEGPFGAAGAINGNSPGAQRNPFRFTGALYSPELGLYKLGERWYDPALGRWTQADPLLQPYSSREANRYGYAAADPTNLTDPSGLLSLKCIAAGIGVGVAAVGASAAVLASGPGGLAVAATGGRVLAANASGAVVSAVGAIAVSTGCTKSPGVPPHYHPVPGGPAVPGSPPVPPPLFLGFPRLTSEPPSSLVPFGSGAIFGLGMMSMSMASSASSSISGGFMPGCA